MDQKISAVLWDIDGTLLNFPAAEEAAINACFDKFNLGECTNDMLRRYAAINLGYWKRIERSEIDKGRALVARFEDFFSEYSLNAAVAAAFNDEYQVRLGDTVVFEHGAYEAVASLKGVVKQYAVTNGTRTAQRRKLAKSGLDRLLDGVFISEEIGVEKPGEAFFDYVFEHIPVQYLKAYLPVILSHICIITHSFGLCLHSDIIVLFGGKKDVSFRVLVCRIIVPHNAVRAQHNLGE